jgi:hypothetical protein
MSRKALLLANSVTAQYTQTKTPATILRRTVQQISDVLTHLPSPYGFQCTQMIDAKPVKVGAAVSTAARKAAESDSLLLIYYFGHGRMDEEGLAFVHPGTKRGHTATLTFDSLLHQVQAQAPKRVLFVLDCCYAGAAAAQIQSIPNNKYCLIACTTPTTRALFDESLGRPIGIFTSAFLNGISSPRAAVSITDNAISSRSLFEFVRRETQRMTDDAQNPYIQGDLDEPLTVWAEVPSIVEGIAEAPIKSGYSKLVAILRTMRRRTFEDTKTLYAAVLLRYPSQFMTPFKDPDGRIAERPADWTSARR